MFGIFRFILAVNVMVYHVLAIDVIGPYAVYSFFILSGFLMTTIMHDTYGYSFLGLKKYGLNRLLRLFPIYWFLLLLIMAIITFTGQSFSAAYHSAMVIPNELSQWFANLFLIYPDFKPVQYEVRLSPPSWALSIELFFYLIIGLGISKNKIITWVFFVSSLSLVFYSILNGKGIGYGTILEASLPFALGGMLFHYREHLKTFINYFSIGPFLFVSLVLLIANLAFAIYLQQMVETTVFSIDKWKIGTLCTLFNMMFSCFVIIGLYFTRAQSEGLKRMDRELGDLSYPLYIFHSAAASLLAWFFYRDNLSLIREPSLAIFVSAFIVTVFVCWVSNFLVNKPVERIRDIIKKQNAKPE